MALRVIGGRGSEPRDTLGIRAVRERMVWVPILSSL